MNAYVDGELDASTAAEIAHAAGSDPAVADQIALLYQLKGSIHAAAAPPPSDLAGLLPARRSMLRPAIAATLLALAIGLGAWWSLAIRQTPALPAELVSEARSLHYRWLDADAAGLAVAQPGVLFAALSRFGRVPMVPDLESTGLTVATVSVREAMGGQLLQIGYRGHHGCHLSLFVVTDKVLPTAAVELDNGTDLAHGWRVGELGYLLFAKGMDKSRFALIAEKVEHATRVNAPLDQRARQELAENKRNSTSCHA
jgi:hypothetical protein